MLKILQLHNAYKEKGGEDIILNNDLLILKKNGHLVESLIKKNSDIKNLKNIINLTLTHLGLSNEKAKLLDLLNNNTDIVHIYNYFPQWPTWIFKFLKKKNIPIVISLGNYRLRCINGIFYRENKICMKCLENDNFIFPVFKKCYRNNFLQSLYAKIYQYFLIKNNIFNYVDAFIVPHEFSKKTHELIGVPKKKIYIKPNFTAYPNLNSLNYNSNSEFVVYVGRVNQYKGINWIIDNWNNLNTSLKLIIISPSKTDHIKLNNNQNIIFEGQMDNKLIINHISKAKFMIFPSRMYEAGTPLSLIEGLAAGLPILGSNITPVNEMISHGLNGLLYKIDDFDDFSFHFRKLENNAELLKKMSKNSRAIFLQKFSEKINYDKLIKIYSNVLKTKIY